MVEIMSSRAQELFPGSLPWFYPIISIYASTFQFHALSETIIIDCFLIENCHYSIMKQTSCNWQNNSKECLYIDNIKSYLRPYEKDFIFNFEYSTELPLAILNHTQ